MPKDVRIIPAQGSIDFSLSQGFITSLIQLTDSGTLSIASTGPIQIGASNTVAIQIVSNNFVGINTAIPSQNLHVQGNLRLTGGLYDSTNSPGTANQLLISTGSGVAWTSVNVTGILTASGGIANRVSKFLDEDTLGNSNITDSGTQIVLGSASSVSGILTSFGYFGPGTNITNLNASNLASGTVPSAVVSGSYSGITSVGTLGFLNVTGVTTAGGFSGPGTNLTNLNASNLASGTVASARISGAYSGITSVGTLNGLTVSPGNIVLSPSIRSQTTSSPARYLYRGINNTLGARNESSVSLSPTFGRILNRNPDLLDQRLGYGTYDNNSSNQVNIGVTSDFSAPNSSGYVLAINYLGIGITAPSPGLGGYFVGLPKVTGPRDLPNLYGYRRGERIWHRIWASISTGYSINFGSNPYGDNGQFTWISSTIGTNDWYLYEAIQNIGTSGTFSDTAYYYLNSSVGTSNPVTWYVASTHLIGEDESPTVQYTSNLNIGYTTGLNQNFGDFANTGTTLLALNSANVGIRTFSPTRAFDVNADIRLRAILYDGNNTAGSAGQLLASTATGVVWTSITASGIITGIGSINVIPKFGSTFSLTTSNISDSGTQIVFNTNTNTVGLATFRNISLTTSSLTTSAFMQFVGAYGDPITLNVGLATTGSISFNGSQGQLFTITNNLTTGSIFSVNDVSGIPSIDVNANGNILIAPYGGNIGIGTTNAPDPFRVQTTSRFIGLATFGAVNITRNLYDANSSTGLAGQLLSSVGAGVAWSSAASLGVVTGTGAASQITVWNSNNTITGFSTFVFVNPGVGINTTAPIKSLHIRNNGILIDGSSTSDPTGYAPRLIIDSGASSAFVLADFKNNLGSVFYVTGSRVSIGNSSVVTNVFNVNGGDALINTLTVGLGSGQIATNTAVGFQALLGVTTGVQVTAFGYQAGLSNTIGIENTFIGYLAGRTNTSGSANIAVGGLALFANSTGGFNVAVGRGALNANTIGNNNAALGHGALSNNTSGSNNAAFGFLSLQNNVTTSGNTGIGRDALRYYANSSNQTAVGFGALQGNGTVALNTGTGNVAVGYQAGLANTSGSNNTFIGELAGTANTSGSNNLFVGYSAGSANLTGSNNVVLGYLNFASNTLGSFNFVAGGMNANTTGNSNSGAGLFSLNSNTTGSNNTAFGRDALRYWATASNQTAVGSGALQGNSTVALNTGNSNIAVGFQAGVANTSGSLNSYLGHQAGQANASGTHNTLVGALAGLANTASHNTVLGANSFAANTSGSANVIVGSLAAQANVSGANNVGVGYNVIVSNTTGNNNTAVGYQAMEQNTTGGSNVAIGRFALRYYQAVSNQVAIGDSALAGSSTVALNTGTQNTAIGYAAGAANTSGVRNVFIGWSAGIANTSGSDNVAVGNQALWGNQTGIQNVAIGSFALNFNILGNYNIAIGQDTLSNFENTSTQVAIGYRALRGNNTRGLNTGFSNVAVGREALGVNTSGSNNTALGAQAGLANTTGNQNTFIGAQSGDGNITGNSNTYLGYLTDGLPAGSYQIAVGDSVTPTASNLGAWGGNTNATRTNLGVGTFTPLGRLHVETLAATNIGVYIAGFPSQTGNLFEIDATTNGPAYFVTTGIGSVGIYTSVPTQPLHVQGNVRITGGILDSNNQIGLAGSVLSSTGSGISWIASAGASSVTGSGSTNRVAKFSSPSSVTDSTITDTGSAVTIGVGLSVSGFSSSFGFYGPGTFITNLNASNLASGTVPSAVVSGAYSGITSVGTLTQLITTGIATLQNLELDGWLMDVNNSIGSSGQILSSTGSGVAWSSSTSLGIVTGSGFANQVTFWATNDRITGISTFIYNGALGIGTINPRGSLETNNEIYVDNIYFGIGNSFTNTLIGFAASDGSFLDESVLIGYSVNDGSNSSKGVIIGSNASKGNDFNGFIDNAFSHVIIGARASSNNIIRPGGGGKVIIGSNAYSYINNINDQDSGNLVVIGADAYSGTAANLKEDVVRSTIIGPSASQYASHGDSVIIGTLTGFNTDPANLYSSIYNTIIGNDAGINFNSASYNTIIGRAANSQTANSVFSGGYNVLLGDSTQVSNNNYQIAIGANATVSKTNSGAWGGITNLDRVDLGIGTFAAAARLHVQTLSSVNNGILVAGGVGQTASLLEVDATLNGVTYFIVTGIGSVGVNTSIPTQSLDVNGSLRLRERLFDNSNSSGSLNQILISTGSGIAWTTSTTTGIITGTGVVNSVARFSGPNSLSTSTITDNGSVVTIGVGVSIAGFSSSFGFYGPGTNLTNLNASNLASGTVPSAVVSGSYSGITSVGNLTNLNVIGIASATGFTGDGANLTNLNASNLASGIVPSAVVSGTYSGITSVGTQSQLIVSGFSTLSNVRISGALYDTSFGPGLPGRLLSSTGSGIAWTTTDASGIVTSLIGTVNAIPKYNSPFSFTTSNITDNGVAVTVASRLNVTGIGSFTADLIVNGLTIGLGSGQNNTNVAMGISALAQNPSNNGSLIAIGDRAMSLTFGSFFGSIAIGAQTLQNNQGSRNIGIGNNALRLTTTGASNVAIGHQSMDQNVTGSANVAVGRGTLQNSTSSSNTAIGDSVMNLTTSDENTAVGANAANSLISGRANTAFGVSALRYVSRTSNLTAIGYAALAGSATTTLNSGTQNTALGYQAGTANTSGANNVFIGFQAGLANTSGSRNVFVGRSSGVFISSGSDNTFIGDATNGVPGASYQIGVGASVIPTASNFGAWGGNTNATRTDLGVGTFSPQARIHVETLAAGNRGLYIAGAASQTSNLIEVDATTNGSPLFLVTGIGSVGINTGHAPRYLYVQGDTRLNGPVGIVGDPVAGYPLSVSGSIFLTQGSVLSWSAGNADIQSGSGSAFDMRFRTFSGSFARENMRIMSNGNVGIGTTGPFARLHVQGVAATNTPLILSGFGTPTVDLFRIEQSLNGTRYITVDSAGELGIGTSTPTQSLHVQLNSRFNGAIFDVNNSPGAPIGIVSQALFSTGTGVTWAPVKRNLVVPLMTAFNPTQVGIDSAIFIVPQDPINGTSSMTFNFRRVNVRVETPSAAGITTINIAKSTGTGQFVGTSILSANINLTGAATYEASGTSFAVGYTTASSGDKLAINFVGVNTFHQNLTVELIAIEA